MINILKLLRMSHWSFCYLLCVQSFRKDNNNMKHMFCIAYKAIFDSE